jgi:pyruvate/2-oxoglutarate dehydrogenase complex dihydrolipoamide acyltransferase (E2) component
MPSPGCELADGKVSSWLEQVGDAVERGEPIA